MGKGDNGGFSQEQIDMYKECFKLMDVDKDGTLSKSDLRAAFDNVGKLMDEGELDAMLGEVGGGCNFDNMVKMFQEKMAGGKLYFFILFVALLGLFGHFWATFGPFWSIWGNVWERPPSFEVKLELSIYQIQHLNNLQRFSLL